MPVTIQYIRTVKVCIDEISHFLALNERTQKLLSAESLTTLNAKSVNTRSVVRSARSNSN